MSGFLPLPTVQSKMTETAMAEMVPDAIILSVFLNCVFGHLVLPGWHRMANSQNPPIKGTQLMNIHAQSLPASRSLRIVADNSGTARAVVRHRKRNMAARGGTPTAKTSRQK